MKLSDIKQLPKQYLCPSSSISLLIVHNSLEKNSIWDGKCNHFVKDYRVYFHRAFFSRVLNVSWEVSWKLAHFSNRAYEDNGKLRCGKMKKKSRLNIVHTAD